MVSFGKKLAANQVQEWKEFYINYKLSKKKVRQYAQQIETGGKNRCHVLKEFSRMLDDLVHHNFAGVNLSLLSKVMSSRLARETYNGGLLSTEAGTMALLVADAAITLAGYLGVSKLINVTLLPSLLICVPTIAATIPTYNSHLLQLVSN